MSSLKHARTVAAGISRLLGNERPIKGVKPTEAKVLFALGREEPLTDAALVLATGADKSLISRAVAALQAKAYIAFQPSSRHKRQRLFFLTPRGSQLLENLDAATGSKAAALATMGTHELAALQTLAYHFGRAGRSQTTPSSYSVSKSTARDLAWMLTKSEVSVWSEPKARSRLRANAATLANHIQIAPTEVPHSWVLRNWSDRAGGCVLTPDYEDPGDAWIQLLRLPTDRDAALMLLRECILAAQTQEYISIRYKLTGTALLRELFSQLGFHPVKGRSDPVMGGLAEAIWELRLLPEFDPSSET
jgi:DNA-binding MarR family transcriptional regulator